MLLTQFLHGHLLNIVMTISNITVFIFITNKFATYFKIIFKPFYKAVYYYMRKVFLNLDSAEYLFSKNVKIPSKNVLCFSFSIGVFYLNNKGILPVFYALFILVQTKKKNSHCTTEPHRVWISSKAPIFDVKILVSVEGFIFLVFFFKVKIVSSSFAPSICSDHHQLLICAYRVRLSIFIPFLLLKKELF